MAEGIITDDALKKYYEKLLPYLEKQDKRTGAKTETFEEVDDETKDMLRMCLQSAFDLIADTVAEQSIVDPALPPIGEGERKAIAIEIQVPENFEKRLDMQWVVEREIKADRWNWKWKE